LNYQKWTGSSTFRKIPKANTKSRKENMSRMFPLRLFAVYLLFTPDIPADGTYSLSPILTSVLFPTRSCQIYFNHVDQKNTTASNIPTI